MKPSTDNNHSDSNQCASHDDGVTRIMRKECGITYDGGYWFFTVLGEGIAKVKDSMQSRALLALILRSGNEVVPSDIEDAAKEGPRTALCFAPPVLAAKPTTGIDDAEDEDSAFFASGEEDSDMEHDKTREVNRGDDGWKSEVASDYRDHVDEILPLHTGPLADPRMLREINKRIKDLDDAIVLAVCRGHGHKATSLKEERKALWKFRSEYFDPKHGNQKLFYPAGVENQAQRCRMWLLRSLNSLTKGLPETAVRLENAVHRGASFYCAEMPGLTFRFAQLPAGLPRLGKQADKRSAA